MIELQQICKSYKQHQVLENIDLFIQQGEIFGIIGKSGAGKSTLLRTLNLLEKPTSGEVIIDSINITHLTGKKLRDARHKIGMIFQGFNLLNTKNIYDNIALPLRIQGVDEVTIEHKITEILKLVELSDKRNYYPRQLSGGQKQRVAIARALATSPKILLSDEATSALDPETTESILNLLRKINLLYGITIVLITHELEIVKRICHRISVIEKGKLNETRAIGDVFNKKGSVLWEMFYTQLSPQLPTCLSESLTQIPNDTPLLKLFFQGTTATTPFISKASRELNIDINILLANVDRFDNVTCGVLIVELQANHQTLTKFIERATNDGLTVEVLGYVTDNFL